ncbi:MAG: WD40/YVTN/BNR-like repeat-containing protein [Acidimicrobiia bacterium]
MDLLIGTSAGAFRADGGSLIEGTRINHLALAGDSWWAADGKGRIHRDGAVVAEMPDRATPLCIQPTPETVWIGADEARLYGYEHGAITEDEYFREAPGRERWYTPWGAPADVRSMALDADHTLYVNVHVGGILRYDDTGPVPTVDISADVHQVAAHPTERGAIFAATAQGLAQSSNGHDFAFRTEGLHSNYCRAVAVLDDRVLVSASTGPRTERGRLYRGMLWEGPLEAVTEGMPTWFEDNLDSHCLVAKGDTAFAGFEDTVWRSDDGGDSWVVMISDLPKITCLA